jgi:hypothetical protein
MQEDAKIFAGLELEQHEQWKVERSASRYRTRF